MSSKNLEQLIQKTIETGIHDQKQIQQLLYIAENTPSEKTAETAKQKIVNKIIEQLDDPFHEKYSSPSTTEQSITIGYTLQNQLPVAIPEQELNQHLLISGQTGAGKTTLIYNILQQLSAPYWIFDLKQDYRHLYQHTEEQILIFPQEQLLFNPLKPPPRVSTKNWVSRFSEIFADSQALLNASSNFLGQQLDQLYQQKRKRNNGDVPIMEELVNHLENLDINYSRKPGRYRDTVLNRIREMNRDTGQMFQTRENHHLKTLLDYNTVFELDGLKTSTQNFLMEILLAWLYEHRKKTGNRGTGLQHVTVLDESKTVFSKYKESQVESGIPEIDKLTAQIREFGEGIITADQEPAKLTDSIKANTKTKIVMASSDLQQIEAMTESMKTNNLQKEFIKNLRTGQAVIQSQNQPVQAVKIPSIDIEKNLSQKDVVQEMQNLWKRLNPEKHRASNKDPENTSINNYT